MLFVFQLKYHHFCAHASISYHVQSYRFREVEEFENKVLVCLYIWFIMKAVHVRSNNMIIINIELKSACFNVGYIVRRRREYTIVLSIYIKYPTFDYYIGTITNGEFDVFDELIFNIYNV